MECPNCPVCGQPPLYLFGEDQAFCGTGPCKVIAWDPSVTAAENPANAHYVKLGDD